MKVLLFLLITTSALAWYPTIDGARIELDYVQEAPYWLGMSVPPGTGPINVRIYQRGPRGTGFRINLEEFVGTNTQLQYVTINRPVRFIDTDTRERGSIVPEPLTMAILAGGALLIRRKK